MEMRRKPFQGVLNIIRFNWHFYVIASIIFIAVFTFIHILPIQIQPFVFGLTILAILTTVTSLFVSFYVYDHSDLYELNWLPNLNNQKTLNINAGFDESSKIISSKFPETDLTISDFYNPKKHTEISIKRARKAYPPTEKTIQVSTNKLPFQDNAFDYSLAIFSAHEIRDPQEKIRFFKELNRITKPTGQIYITEHLRDINNFMAYSIGFFHFHSRSNWLDTFEQSNLGIKEEIKSTHFITTFILERNGDTL